MRVAQTHWPKKKHGPVPLAYLKIITTGFVELLSNLSNDSRNYQLIIIDKTYYTTNIICIFNN